MRTVPDAVTVSVDPGLDASARPLTDLLAEAVAELEPAVTPNARAIGRVTFARSAPPAEERASSAWVQLLDGDAPELSSGTKDMLSMAGARLPRRLRDGRLGAARAVPYAELGPYVAACRMRTSDVRHIGRAGRVGLRELAASAREALRRCARALTGRRVGVALGGAGAWGYAGAALILELLERGVPIDVVAGSSSGALIGAYFCVGGAAGIQRIIRRGPELARSMWMMALSSSVVELGVDGDLGGARLESLELPLLPVVSNLGRQRAEVVLEGSCGLGVRASVSAPGIFGPTFIGDQLYVDGAVSDNVPTALLESLGAGLVISGNLLPAATMSDARLSARTRRQTLVRALNPFGRMNDLAVAFQFFMHEAGNAEPSERRVTYRPEPVAFPLLRTFQYSEAARVVDAARRDPLLVEAAETAARKWRAMTTRGSARPRVARVGDGGH